MIVRHVKTGWCIISHHAHGLLAGNLAMALSLDIPMNLKADFLAAVIEHDDGMLDYDEKQYLTESGAPLDFTMESKSIEVRARHGWKLHHLAKQKSLVTAALIGKHTKFLNEGVVVKSKELRKLFTEIDTTIEEALKLHDLKREELEHFYDALLFCDRLSLILSQDKIPAAGRKLEINKTINNHRYFIERSNDDSILIEPWPFIKDKIKVHFEFRTVDKMTFESNHELQNSLKTAETKSKVVSLTRIS